MPIGQKVGNLKSLKASLAKGGGNNTWIKYIPKNGSMNVRFIQEPEEWVNYVEHYDQTLRKSYPCNGETSCPGCTSGERKSYRYLANALNLDDQNRLIPLQLPKDLANRLVVKYEKWGTLTDRDIELTRQGEGLDTVYDLDPDVPSKRRIDQQQPLDLLKVLDDAFRDVFGGATDEEPEEVTPPSQPVKMRRQSKAAQAAIETQAAEPEADDADDGEDLPDALKPGAGMDKPEPTFTPEADDASPEADDDDDASDDDEGYTEDDLKALPLGALRGIARAEFGLDPKGKNATQIIAEIMATAESSD